MPIGINRLGWPIEEVLTQEGGRESYESCADRTVPDQWAQKIPAITVGAVQHSKADSAQKKTAKKVKKVFDIYSGI